VNALGVAAAQKAVEEVSIPVLGGDGDARLAHLGSGDPFPNHGVENLLGFGELRLAEFVRVDVYEIEKLFDSAIHRFDPISTADALSDLLEFSFIAFPSYKVCVLLRTAGEWYRSGKVPRASMYLLEVMSGPLDGTRWRFDWEIVIGRDEALDGACIPFDRYLSRTHARIKAIDGHLHLRDLTSRNGTTVSGKVVTDELLEVGRRFTCGRTMFSVLKADEVEASEGAAPRAAPSLETVTSSEEMRARRPVGAVGFVPTMGALHEGHLALIRRARAEVGLVVVSIFVNPLQFAAGEDFDRYPRAPERDAELLIEHGVDVLFAPALGTFYGPDFSTAVDVGELGRCYEGAIRPTHFRGVATVVVKLLNIVRPTKIYLGQKDAQQVAVLKRLVSDLSVPVEVVVLPTVREEDGLACSSRNVRLTEAARRRAPVLYRALTAVAAAYRHGASREEVLSLGRAFFGEAGSPEAPLPELEYLDLVHRLTFLPLASGERKFSNALAIGALRLDGVRLIDNVPVREEV
jgi:pantoate--beta-alanine ligase